MCVFEGNAVFDSEQNWLYVDNVEVLVGVEGVKSIEYLEV